MNPETQFSKERIEMLCDGVFAIAMTLLVLDLKVPELPKHTASIEIWHALREHGLSFFAFALTFALAGQFWLIHHVFFHYLKHATRGLAALNLLFLMFVSLLPFTTSMFAAFGSQQAGMVPYIANQFILASLIGTQWLLARSQGLLTGAPTDPKRRRFAVVITALPTLFGLLLIGELIMPGSLAWALLPGVIVVRILSRRVEKRARAALTS
ncbi:MAG: DUF1211 domain-containing protein [Acidobacteriia bacterium]|nr:DUF1211 domain-containing protein [Terriglobia bacterium]